MKSLVPRLGERMSKRKRSAVWTCRLLYLLAVTFYLLHVDCCSTCIWYRIVSISILPIPSGEILGIVSILYLLVSPITIDLHKKDPYSIGIDLHKKDPYSIVDFF